MPFPSFEQLSVPPTVNPEALRLHWTISGPISEAVFVLDEINDPAGPRQPAIQQAKTTQESPKLHPISQLSLYEPPVSSVTVEAAERENWAGMWPDLHVSWDLSDLYGLWYDEDGPCGCCGRIPPAEGRTVTVRAKDEENFITIGDYVAAVHPWLLDLREDLLWALSQDADAPLPDKTILMVGLSHPDWLRILEPQEWLIHLKRARQSRAQS
ncbi:hypothetical protein E4U21_004432 [Claviceps maximensis]|nr:hypothetical protein E4U21_004432 [Claviceps maximensis]